MHILPTLLLLSAAPVGAEPLPDPATCTEGIPAYIEAVATGGKKEAYFCLAALDEAPAALITDLETRQESQRTRVSRALAVHLLQRLDAPLPPEAVGALEPVDRRLLRDGIYAHRGRKTPSEDHAVVFEQFDWYQPKGRFNNRALTEVDRQNITFLDTPPPEEEPEEVEEKSAAEAIAETQEAAAGEGGVETWCGCQAAAAPAALAWLVGLGALVRRRR